VFFHNGHFDWPFFIIKINAFNAPQINKNLLLIRWSKSVFLELTYIQYKPTLLGKGYGTKYGAIGEE
jgi:hypothetical protein